MATRLSLAIRDRTRLYESHMPFVKGGGLFIPTDVDCALGEEVSVLLDLMHEPESIGVHGWVVWITPRAAQGQRIAGIGIRFDLESDAVRKRIEAYLAGTAGSQQSTFTL